MTEVKVVVETSGDDEEDAKSPDEDKNDHGSGVVWAAAPTKVPDEELPKWSASVELAGPGFIIGAQGPCPTCRLPASGLLPVRIPAPVEPALPTIKGPDLDTSDMAGVPVPPPPPPETWRVPVTCNCGYNHGKDDATGCGRMWLVVCEEARS